MISKLLDDALRSITQARELFLHHNGEDFDIDWVADQFNIVTERLEELKDIASLRREETDEVT